MHGLESIRLCGIMTLACGHGSLLLHLHFSQGHNTKRCSVLPVYSHSLTLAALLKEQHQHAQNTHTSKRLGVARDSQKIATPIILTHAPSLVSTDYYITDKQRLIKLLSLSAHAQCAKHAYTAALLFFEHISAPAQCISG